MSAKPKNMPHTGACLMFPLSPSYPALAKEKRTGLLTADALRLSICLESLPATSLDQRPSAHSSIPFSGPSSGRQSTAHSPALSFLVCSNCRRDALNEGPTAFLPCSPAVEYNSRKSTCRWIKTPEGRRRHLSFLPSDISAPCTAAWPCMGTHRGQSDHRSAPV